MLHLLPVRRLLIALAATAGLAVLAAGYAGWVGTGDAFNDVKYVIRISSSLVGVSVISLYAAWRWIVPLQRLTFPYLGGFWCGELHFSGPNGSGIRPISLDVSHILFNIKLILDSAESTSRTLVVHADRDIEVNRDRLYYVYLNERKEGFADAGDHYRGLAIMRVDFETTPKMFGNYFTEREHKGTLSLQRMKCHPWWKLWK